MREQVVHFRDVRMRVDRTTLTSDVEVNRCRGEHIGDGNGVQWGERARQVSLGHGNFY